MTHVLDSIALDRVPSPLGELLVVFDRAATLWALDFDDHAQRMQRLLRTQQGLVGELAHERAPNAVREAFDRYFAGELSALDALVVHLGGSAFQRSVWMALRAIPPGRTATYGELAHALGRPKACRAVGRANGSNPLGIVLPCHRVIGADGALTGYGGGLERKRWLLAHEARWRGTPRANAGEPLPHSARSASIGSACVARSAGSVAASSATALSASAMPRNTRGSHDFPS